MTREPSLQLCLNVAVATAVLCAFGSASLATDIKDKISVEPWENINISYEVEEADGAKTTMVYKLNDKTMAALHESKSTDVDLMSDFHAN